ncbi:hypothetical protein ES705_23129 [subsurface metagenome]
MTIHILNGHRCCILSGIDRSCRVTVRTDSGHVMRVPVAALTATRGYDEVWNAADAAPPPPHPLNRKPSGVY